MKCAPKQVEKVGCGSLPKPFSVPATLAVKPERKWYMAWLGVSRAMGGKTPKASAVSEWRDEIGRTPRPNVERHPSSLFRRDSRLVDHRREFRVRVIKNTLEH